MQRLNQLTAWLEEAQLGDFRIEPASSDASFRRYFRVSTAEGSFIAMDAPPEKEDSTPFVHIARRLERAGVHVPHIYAADLQQGFVLLSDLGSRHYLESLNADNADALYGDAIEALIHIQRVDPQGLPPYDHAFLRREMDLFSEWFLDRHLGLRLDTRQRGILDEVLEGLCRAALAQPRVFVHRDYHSRNLMHTASDNPGVLDFQDAMHGPVSYDLVSLLKDAYLRWPHERVQGWALHYRERALAAGVLPDIDEADFLRDFDLMGLQRHLKVVGIFARLNHRDHKPGYLDDIPRVLGYIFETGARYEQTRPLLALLEASGVHPDLTASA